MRVLSRLTILSISFLFVAMSFLALSILTKDASQKVEAMTYAEFAFLAAMAILILAVVVIRVKKHILRNRYRPRF